MKDLLKPGSRWWDRATTDLDELAERLGVPVEEVPEPLAKHGLPSDRAIEAAARIYADILADPERTEQIRANRSRHAIEHDLDYCLYCASTSEPDGRHDPYGPSGRCTVHGGVHCLRPREWDEWKEEGIE